MALTVRADSSFAMSAIEGLGSHEDRQEASLACLQWVELRGLAIFIMLKLMAPPNHGCAKCPGDPRLAGVILHGCSIDHAAEPLSAIILELGPVKGKA